MMLSDVSGSLVLVAVALEPLQGFAQISQAGIPTGDGV
jgi:hypothetical protein